MLGWNIINCNIRNTLLFLGILLLNFGNLNAISFDGKTKHALLIGVSNYMQGSDWPDINSYNDIKLIHQCIFQMGFLDENILILENASATKAKIIEALKLFCSSKLKPGDVFYFHFSGHGQQKTDLNQDEVDGLDECIVPFDSPKNFLEGQYEGENLIADDELALLFECIRKKLGPLGHLLVTIDACHSGTSIRGFNLNFRGTETIMTDVSGVNNAVLTEDEEDNTILNTNNIGNNKLASLIAFFGSTQHQLNYEYKANDGLNYGSLSYSFTKGLLNSNTGASYRELYEKIRVEMALIAPYQNPQFEGNLDRLVLNGELKDKEQHFSITQSLNDSMFYIDAGFINGLTVGSVLAYNQQVDQNSESKTKPYQARIVQTQATSSLIKLNTSINTELSKNLKFFLLERNAIPEISKFWVFSEENVLSTEVHDFLFKQSFLKPDFVNPKILIKILRSGQNSLKIRIENNEKSAIDSIICILNQAHNKNLIKITDIIKNYLRGDYFKSLDFQSEDLNLVLSVNLVNAANLEKNKIKFKKPPIDNRQIKFLKLGNSISFSVLNMGSVPAYFCLIDIQPDNKIKLLFPRGSHTTEDYRILPAQQLNLKEVFKIAKPTGFETFKLIATTIPFDFNGQFNNRSFINDSPIKCLFSENIFDLFESRSSNSLEVQEGTISVFTDVYSIIE